MKIPGGKKPPLGRLVWSLPSGTPLTARTAPPIAPMLKPGTVTLLNYYHDESCPKLAGGACQCDPDMEFLEVTKEEGSR